VGKRTDRRITDTVRQERMPFTRAILIGCLKRGFAHRCDRRLIRVQVMRLILARFVAVEGWSIWAADTRARRTYCTPTIGEAGFE
jgi:hypothetical protein